MDINPHATIIRNSWRIKPSGCSMIWLIGLMSPRPMDVPRSVCLVRSGPVSLDYAVTEVSTGVALWAWSKWCQRYLSYATDCYVNGYMYMVSCYWLIWLWKWMNDFLTCCMLRSMIYRYFNMDDIWIPWYWWYMCIHALMCTVYLCIWFKIIVTLFICVENDSTYLPVLEWS